MESSKTYTLIEIEKAFRKYFYDAGEFWFLYEKIISKEDCEESFQCQYKEFLKELDEVQ